ncbi:hypothetical protein [Haloarchaeobius iranensis]|uniref:Uncharacterized protein n=1 Tax=Haloarchaeobius iranensis TaxID=996166 RepID=A0A1G9TS80_9EURY|nr:hypothetical protein [Haloarchaeobius iranensis]SDM50035.1 hypothetical protein SAMN05192554_10371 [Haloarchaeobius iranensis]
MDRRPWLALALVLSMVLAGCGGTAGVQTRDPFSVPETSAPDPAEDDLVPVDAPFSPDPTENVLGDPSVFLDSQATRLDGTSYTLDYELDVRYENGTTWNNVVVDAQFARNRSIYVSNVTQRGRSLNVTRLAYGNGSVLYAAQGTAGLSPAAANFSVVRTVDGAPVEPSEGVTLRALRPEFLYNGFASMNVADVRELDRTPAGIRDQLFYVRATEVTQPDTLANDAFSNGEGVQVENATLEAIVASDGFVHEYSIRYTVVREDGTRLHVSRRLVYRHVGSTNVTVPSTWGIDNATVTRG